MRALVKRVAALAGLDVRRLALVSADERRQYLIDTHGITQVLDVGANAGQYVTRLRGAGYTGQIASYEPLPDAFAALSAQHGRDPRWTGHNTALGSHSGSLDFFVSEDSVCSSPLQPTEDLLHAVAQARSTRIAQVPVTTLDEGRLCTPDERLLLKIDTQGYEDSVLDGAESTLERCLVVEIEMALQPLYVGGSWIGPLMARLAVSGFRVHSLEPGYIDPASRRTLDVDVLLTRDRLL